MDNTALEEYSLKIQAELQKVGCEVAHTGIGVDNTFIFVFGFLSNVKECDNIFKKYGFDCDGKKRTKNAKRIRIYSKNISVIEYDIRVNNLKELLK